MPATNPARRVFVAIEAPFSLALANLSNSGTIAPWSVSPSAPACAPLITRELRDKRSGQAQSFFAGRFIAKSTASRYLPAKTGRFHAPLRQRLAVHACRRAVSNLAAPFIN